MTTIRVPHRRRFTSIDRATLNDASLSFRARGVLAWLLDKPDDWTTTADAIAVHGLEGRDAIRAVLNELELNGYLLRRKWRAVDNGRWKSEWTVMETPLRGQDQDGKPALATSDGKPGLLLKTELKTDLELRALADPQCITCRGVGNAYSPGAGRFARCPCTVPYVVTERDVEAVS